jgi:hypothetical protein
MNLFRRLIGLVPCQDIGDGKGSVFFYRYTLLKTRRFAVYLHEFLRSDHDRCLHDHPWSFATLILRGGYWEVTPERWAQADPGDENPVGEVRHWRQPGYFGRYPADHAHRIEIEPGTRPWSLVFVGRKHRPWGFYTRDGFVRWKPGYSPICEAGAEKGA